MTMKKKIGEY